MKKVKVKTILPMALLNMQGRSWLKSARRSLVQDLVQTELKEACS